MQELKQVTWPNRKETLGATGVVLILVVLVSLYLGLVDFGLSELTDEDGNALGYFHVYTYGSIAYARDVGPVHSYERAFVQMGATPGPGAADWTLSLKTVTPGPSAVTSR